MWAVRKSHTTKTRARGSFAKGKRRRTNRGQTVDGISRRPPLAHRLPPLSTGKSRQPPVLAKNRKIKNRQFFRLSLGHGGDKAPAGGQEKSAVI
jgi:hypothetical protein